jgi:hypothetical protein
MTASEKQIGGNHYKDCAIQPTEFIQRNGLNWCEGNAVKYVCRHRAKGQRQDIEKAIHYLQLLLEYEYGEWFGVDTSHWAWDDVGHCGECGEPLELVRPGKSQCPNCG